MIYVSYITTTYTYHDILSIFIDTRIKKTYQHTHKSAQSAKELQKLIHPCDSGEMAAILDAIVDFKEIETEVNWIHPPDFVCLTAIFLF